MALPNIASTDESVVDILKQNNTLLAEIVSTLEGQVNVAKNLAEDERIRDENEQFSDIEEASESSSGMLGGGISSAYTGAKAELGNLKGLFPFGGMGAVVGGGILASLIYMFRDSITEFLQENAADALEMLGVGEDLTDKVKDFLSNAAGVGIGASIGKIFGFRGALLGGLLGYIVQDYGLGRLFDDDETNDQAVIDEFFAQLKSDPSKVGLEIGALLGLMGQWRIGFAVALGAFIFEELELERLFSEEGRADIMKGLKQEFDGMGVSGLGAAIGVAVATVIAGSLRGPAFGNALKRALGFGGVAAATLAAAPSAVPQDIVNQSNTMRTKAAIDVLTDEDLAKAGLVKDDKGVVRRAAGSTEQVKDRRGRPTTRNIGGRIVGADVLEDVVRSSGREAQYNKKIIGGAPNQTNDPKQSKVLGKISRFTKAAGGIGLVVNTAVLVSIAMGPGTWEEKAKIMAVEIGGMGGAAVGALIGLYGGLVGSFIGGSIGYFVGAKLISEWLTSDSDSDLSESDINQAMRTQFDLTNDQLKILSSNAAMSSNLSEQDDFLLQNIRDKSLKLRARIGNLAGRDFTPRATRKMEEEIVTLSRELSNDIEFAQKNIDFGPIDSTVGAFTQNKGIIPSVDVNQVSDFTRGLKSESASVTIASYPTTTIVNNSTNVSSSRGGSGGMPAGAAYNQDQSYMRLQQNVIA